MTHRLTRRLDATTSDFSAQLQRLLELDDAANARIESTVSAIIADVRQRGDTAVMEYTNRFDRTHYRQAEDFIVGPEALAAAHARLAPELRQALQTSVDRVRHFHEHQTQSSWEYEDAQGTVLGQRITPLDRVGLYVPGGSAPLASSVVMTAVTAQVAGVEEIVMAHPAPDGQVQDFVLAAAWLSGVTRVYTLGGAQAIAAMAYGTESVPAVDKIVGPGNIFVATAKKQVFGKVGIDMIAGPSEILIVSDGTTDPDWLAMDLCSQAEHDELAQAILIAPDAAHLDAVETSLQALVPTLERADIIRTSLKNRGALIQVPDLASAMTLVNRVAPEHLELSVQDPQALLPQLRHAGAVFMGAHTSEALGDYVAGPNHVLPTSGTARYSSPLGVYDFQKKTSIIHCSAASASALGQAAGPLARGEQLTAHARSAEYRIRS